MAPATLAALKGWLATDETALVFSHNDLNANNILINDKGLSLIDYEFAGYNKEGFDFSSYINESLYNYNVAEYPFFEFREDCLIQDQDLIFMLQQYLLLKDNLQENNPLDSSFLHKCSALKKSVHMSNVLINHYWVVETVLMSTNEHI